MLTLNINQYMKQRKITLEEDKFAKQATNTFAIKS